MVKRATGRKKKGVEAGAHPARRARRARNASRTIGAGTARPRPERGGRGEAPGEHGARRQQEGKERLGTLELAPREPARAGSQAIPFFTASSIASQKRSTSSSVL
ncbi:MAG: hypothetical protein AMXMBFR77_06650 [Phycisphaerales bacterium]|nr:MAG: hypothetical protein BroJett004_21090 [Planctomycetota bacterium]